MTSLELAQEFTELFESLDSEQINMMLAKNVSFELLEFFVSYAERYVLGVPGASVGPEEIARRVPNLLVIGYIIRLLEERVH
jgi:hypothetical protein